MKNRFNNLTSKEWLPFQKSWFKYTDEETLYRKNIGFFTKEENVAEPLLYYGHNYLLFKSIAAEKGLQVHLLEDYEEQDVLSQFIFIDLRKEITEETTLNDYNRLIDKIESLVFDQYGHLMHRKFVAILASNIQKEETYYPFAWDIAKRISNIYSLKDEKVACRSNDENIDNEKLSYFKPQKEVFYSLYFRQDERSNGKKERNKSYDFFKNNKQLKRNFDSGLPSWFILKPRRRNKNEILHPAKFPEDLVEMFVKKFTVADDNVLDPMSGTGSTQVGAMKLGRNGYGMELSDFFADIARQRCENVLNSEEENISSDKDKIEQDFKILNKDARTVLKDDFPTIDYVFTSPPYWDMLNVKGAENQAKRIKKGLKTKYSEDKDDLGNVEDYQDFLVEMQSLYFKIAAILHPGSYMTIVVKNIKKKGSNYPFAWDLSSLLQEKLIQLPETFWCQDDISIAPYGYGNTWVSNTFHQYCLTFQIPENFQL